MKLTGVKVETLPKTGKMKNDRQTLLVESDSGLLKPTQDWRVFDRAMKRAKVYFGENPLHEAIRANEMAAIYVYRQVFIPAVAALPTEERAKITRPSGMGPAKASTRTNAKSKSTTGPLYGINIPTTPEPAQVEGTETKQ